MCPWAFSSGEAGIEYWYWVWRKGKKKNDFVQLDRVGNGPWTAVVV